MNCSPQQISSDWATRRVLVTGANGFIGRWLVRFLRLGGAEVHVLVRCSGGGAEKLISEGVNVVSGDISNLDLISRLICDTQVDLVYHLAAINSNTGSSISPYEIFETNLRGTYTILEACRNSPRPVHAVIASSQEVEDCFRVGNERKHHPYMVSKAAAELVVRTYFDAAQVPAAIVRLDNIYGGGDLNWHRLVPGIMRLVLQGKTPVIRSNGLLKRDYVYVEDAVAALIAVGERLNHSSVQGRLFRVTTGTGTTVLEMVNHIVCAAGKPHLKPEVLNIQIEERSEATFYKPELEKQILGWFCRFSLKDGMSRTCQWYLEYFSKR